MDTMDPDSSLKMSSSELVLSNKTTSTSTIEISSPDQVDLSKFMIVRTAPYNEIVLQPRPEKEGMRFEQFPTEVRLQIWADTIEPRLVEIRFNVRNRIFHDFVADIPVILHINQESRWFGLKHYELAFQHSGAVAPVYFNFEQDILYPRASTVETQLEWLEASMKDHKHDAKRVRFLAMYNEHLEKITRARFWRVTPFPHVFPNLKTLKVLFKAFVDPRTIDAHSLPACNYSLLQKPLGVRELSCGRVNPNWIRYEQDVLKENLEASLRPPPHSCERNTRKGYSRRTHIVSASQMSRDPNNNYQWALDKTNNYIKQLVEIEEHHVYNSQRPDEVEVWQRPDVVEVWGLCEHGLEFEEAPGLEYEGKALWQDRKDVWAQDI